jgi:hypothetical protein
MLGAPDMRPPPCVRPAGPSRLGVLPLGQPSAPPPVTTYWRRPLAALVMMPVVAAVS